MAHVLEGLKHTQFWNGMRKYMLSTNILQNVELEPEIMNYLR